MQLDHDTLKRLLELDDESFRCIIRQISIAAGADHAKTEAILGDVNGIKQSLSRMSPQQAEKILNSAGKDKSEEILRIINKGKA